MRSIVEVHQEVGEGDVAAEDGVFSDGRIAAFFEEGSCGEGGVHGDGGGAVFKRVAKGGGDAFVQAIRAHVQHIEALPFHACKTDEFSAVLRDQSCLAKETLLIRAQAVFRRRPCADLLRGIIRGIHGVHGAVEQLRNGGKIGGTVRSYNK